MGGIVRLGIRWIVWAIVAASVSVAGAQQGANPAPAPIPSQIATAKKIFIANGESGAIFGIPNLTYNEFYPQIKSWGKYELVSSPADADLVFEIRAGAGGVGSVIAGSVGCGLLVTIRLEILDPKSGIVIWGFTEYVQTANRNSTARTNYDKAVSAVVTDVRDLAAAAAVAGLAGQAGSR
jgi:hypothetical protein